MKHSGRSALMTAVVMLAVSAVVLAPIRPAPPPQPAPTVRLVAAVQPLGQRQQPPLLTIIPDPPRLLLGPSATAAALPSAPAALAVPIAPNLANAIDSAYLAIEPWVQYGFEVAAYAVGWIPYVGFLSGLIMDGYFFGESIVASAVFNFTDFLRGDGSLVENLVDFGVDVGLAFAWLGIDVLGTFVPLPPCCYPPRPPLQGPFLALDAVVGPDEAMMVSSVEESTAPAGTEVDEPEGEPVEGLTGEETGAEEAVTAEGTVDETEVTDKEDEDTDLEGDDDPTTTATGSSGNVQAQGEVRGSTVGTSPDADTDETTDASPGDDANDGPAESVQTPSSNDDDGAASAGDADTGDGDTDSGTQ